MTKETTPNINFLQVIYAFDLYYKNNKYQFIEDVYRFMPDQFITSHKLSRWRDGTSREMIDDQGKRTFVRRLACRRKMCNEYFESIVNTFDRYYKDPNIKSMRQISDQFPEVFKWENDLYLYEWWSPVADSSVDCSPESPQKNAHMQTTDHEHDKEQKEESSSDREYIHEFVNQIIVRVQVHNTVLQLFQRINQMHSPYSKAKAPIQPVYVRVPCRSTHPISPQDSPQPMPVPSTCAENKQHSDNPKQSLTTKSRIVTISKRQMIKQLLERARGKFASHNKK